MIVFDEVLIAGRALAEVATAPFDFPFDLVFALAASELVGLGLVGLVLADLAFLALLTAEVALADLAALAGFAMALLDLDFLDEEGDKTEFATERAKGNLGGKKIEQQSSGERKRTAREGINEQLPSIRPHALLGMNQLEPHSTDDPFLHKASQG